MVYVIQVTVAACEQDQDGTSSVLTLLASCQQTCYVYSEKLDDGQRNSRKHVEFYSKNKFEKLGHLVGFILRVSDSSSVHHQECITVHTTKTVWHVPLLCVQWKTPDDGQRNCPKHVEVYSKNKFETLVHLVGFIIRIYHDARSPERQVHST